VQSEARRGRPQGISLAVGRVGARVRGGQRDSKYACSHRALYRVPARTEIQLDSELGRGTRVRVTFPLVS
jgi:hypothetical protein